MSKLSAQHKVYMALIALCGKPGFNVGEAIKPLSAEHGLTPDEEHELQAEWEYDTRAIERTDWDGNDYVAVEYRELKKGWAT